VFKLSKALYGLKQAPRAWYERLRDFLLSKDFKIGKVDTTLFTKRIGKDLFVCQIYVDDIIFGSTNCDTPGVYFTLCREIYPNLGCSVKISISHSRMSLTIQTIHSHFTGFEVIQSHGRPNLEPVKNFYSRRECKFGNQSRFLKSRLKLI
jgi:hypothetical protein